MKLTTLQIELQPSYADNAGKYIATVQYEEGRSNAVKLVLDPDISMKLLAFVGPAITQAAAAAARQIEANIILALQPPAATLEIANDGSMEATMEPPPPFPAKGNSQPEEQF